MTTHAQAVEAAKNPLDTLDAKLWAEEWMRLFGGDCNERIDEGLMIAWFANAIMKGYDTARNKYESVPGPSRDAVKLAGDICERQGWSFDIIPALAEELMTAMKAKSIRDGILARMGMNPDGSFINKPAAPDVRGEEGKDGK